MTCGDSHKGFWSPRDKKHTHKNDSFLSEKDHGRNQTAFFFFFRNNFSLRGCAGAATTGGSRRAHHLIHVNEMLLLAGSNYITWAPSVPCCLLPRPPVSRWGTLHTLASETKEFQNFPSQGPGAWRRVPTTLAFFNGLSEACSLCALLQDTWLSST